VSLFFLLLNSHFWFVLIAVAADATGLHFEWPPPWSDLPFKRDGFFSLLGPVVVSFFFSNTVFAPSSLSDFSFAAHGEFPCFGDSLFHRDFSLPLWFSDLFT